MTAVAARTIQINKMEPKRIVWDVNEPTQVVQAHKMFEQFVAMGLTPCCKFDPAAEEISFKNDRDIWVSVEVPDGLEILDEGQVRPKTAGQFSILTAKDGDKRVVWDRLHLAQINAAKRMFDDLVKQGLVPY